MSHSLIEFISGVPSVNRNLLLGTCRWGNHILHAAHASIPAGAKQILFL
jgi:hypothetical protein